VDETNFSRDIKSFVIYLLSKEGQDIIKENGFLPLYPLSINS
jgi:ABC-type Fe3+ transport system substrate-binding protein